MSQPRVAPRKRADRAPVPTRNRMGRVQRAIWRAFIANPGRELSTEELVRWAFPRLTGAIEKKHRVSVLRASYLVAEVVRYGWRTRAYFRAKQSHTLPKTGQRATECD